MPSRRRYLASLSAVLAGCSTTSDGSGTPTDVTDESPTDQFATTTDSPTATERPLSTEVERVAVDHPAVAWAVALPQSVTWRPAASPDGGRVFVGIGGDPRETPDGRTPAATGAVVALSSMTGAVDWYERTDAPVATDLLVHDGRLHVATGFSSGYDGVDQRVSAYGFDGAERWRTDVLPGYLSLVASHDGTTFVATSDDATDTGGERCYAIGPEGSTRWGREAGDPWGAAVVDGRLLYDHAGVELGSYDLATGSESWRVPGDALGDGDDAVVTAAGQCFTRLTVEGTESRALVAYSLDDGAEQWRYSPGGDAGGFFPDGVAGLDATDGAPTLVGTDGDRTVFALDAAGEERWRFEADGSTRYRPPVVGDAVYVGTRDGTLHALDPASGEERWRRSFPGQVSVSTVSTGVLVSTYREGERLLASLAADGTERWRYTSAGRLWPRVVAEDRLYVVVGDRTLLAFDLAA